jgi:DNA-binding MarR family transcriptional regulator
VPLTLDDYVVETLMRDLTEHEHSPAAFLVYLFLWRSTIGQGRRRVFASYRELAEGTGLSKSAAQNAVKLLKRRRLVDSTSISETATPKYMVLRPWRRKPAAA